MDGDGLEFKMASTQERGCADELASGQIFGSEVGAIDPVKLVEQGEVGAGNLNVDEIVHGHTGLLEGGLDLVEQDLNFIGDFGGRLARFIQANAPCEVQSVAGQNAVAERQLRIGVGKVDGAAAGLRRRLGKRPANGEQSRNGKHQEYKTCSSIQHGLAVAWHRVLRRFRRVVAV